MKRFSAKPANHQRGFTLMELMVSLGVFSIFLTMTASFMSTWMRSGVRNTRRITDLNQTSRLAIEYAGTNVSRIGAGQLFSPRGTNSSPGFALIPLDVTTSYGGGGPLPLVTGDGGLNRSDQLTFVYSNQNRVARVVWDDRFGQIQLDFQMRDTTRDGSAPPNGSPYPFFTGYFSSVEPSPFAPGPWDPVGEDTWTNSLLLIKTADGVGQDAIAPLGGKGHRSHFQIVRVRNPPVAVGGGNSYQVLINYVPEPTNPFNRWLQALAGPSGAALYYPDAEPGNPYYDKRKNEPSVERPSPGVTMGCTDRDSITKGFNACITAMSVQMQTLFITRPGEGILPPQVDSPALATLTYSLPMTNLQRDTQILAEDIEDFQVEYFFKSDPASSVDFTQNNPQLPGMRGRDDLMAIQLPYGNCVGLWCANDKIPTTHYLKGVRLSLRAASYVGQGNFYSDDLGATNPLVQIGNRVVYDPDPPEQRRLRRTVRQFFSLRNMNTPYQPLDELSVVVQ